MASNGEARPTKPWRIALDLQVTTSSLCDVSVKVALLKAQTTQRSCWLVSAGALAKFTGTAGGWFWACIAAATAAAKAAGSMAMVATCTAVSYVSVVLPSSSDSLDRADVRSLDSDSSEDPS